MKIAACEARPPVQTLKHAPRACADIQRRFVLRAGLTSAVLVTCTAFAAPSTPDSDAQVAPDAEHGRQAQPADQPSGFWTRDSLLGDIGGLRPWLGKYGVTLSATEASEILGNVRGGLRRGVAYDGVTTLSVNVDTEKAFHLPGGTFNVSALQIHGRGLATRGLGTLNTPSGIEAPASTRLWELWYQQATPDDRFDIKVGQQSVDGEFMVSQYAATFLGTMFGWPGVPSYDLPSGGPAFPLAALGVRVRMRLTPSLTALAGVYDGDPLGNDPDKLSGTNFNLGNGRLYIGELQYAINQPAAGANTDASSARGLAGVYKIGVWYNTQRFDDQRLDNFGRSLASPASTGTPATHRGNYSFYAVADQMIWRPDPNQARSIGIFARVAGAPGDRNLVKVSANLGVVMNAPFARRANDSVGLGLSYLKVGSHTHDLDLDKARANGSYGVRTSETALEATYQYQITPWWNVQGDLQYTFNAGAGQNSKAPHKPLRNTFVIGARTNITF